MSWRSPRPADLLPQEAIAQSDEGGAFPAVLAVAMPTGGGLVEPDVVAEVAQLGRHLAGVGVPAIIHIRDASNQAAVLRWALEQLASELKHGSPGGALMADHLAQIMLLQVLRLRLASGNQSGWLGALADPRLTRALGAIHAEPKRRWTLVELAGLAGMSRTSFAERFRDVVGQTPLDYLTGWRMRLAADRLHRSGDSAAAIGFSVDYESEAAFSTAFRRVMGRTPMQHRRARLKSERGSAGALS